MLEAEVPVPLFRGVELGSNQAKLPCFPGCGVGEQPGKLLIHQGRIYVGVDLLHSIAFSSLEAVLYKTWAAFFGLIN